MADEKDPTYKVTDRRKFNLDGTPREDAAAIEPTAPAPPETGKPPDDAGAGRATNVVSFPSDADRKKEAAGPGAAQSQPSDAGPRTAQSSAAFGAAEQSYQQAKRATPTELPPASFLNLVNMLAVEAAVSLGMVETQNQGKPMIDLDTARHMIDLLGVVQQKTRGNLTPEEDNLVDNILADLRMQFVLRSKNQ
ncbi:MAG TPA: DUF1844 domain-containing protein [Blastocatellia bacterium]|nr:DUF1844 domain-containing protein [Blastocatellia bacterium]